MIPSFQLGAVAIPRIPTGGGQTGSVGPAKFIPYAGRPEIVYSEDNTRAYFPGNDSDRWDHTLIVGGQPGGKRYCEFEIISLPSGSWGAGRMQLGVVGATYLTDYPERTAALSNVFGLGLLDSGWAAYAHPGHSDFLGTGDSTDVSYAASQIVQMAFDTETGSVSFGRGDLATFGNFTASRSVNLNGQTAMFALTIFSHLWPIDVRVRGRADNIVYTVPAGYKLLGEA